MPYTPQTWVDNSLSTPLSAARMAVIETGIQTGTATADAAVAKATLTTKGDLYVATAASTVTRLAVGANNTELIADNTQTSGMRWAKRPPLIVPFSQEGVLAVAAGTLRTPLPTGSQWSWEATEVAVSTAPTGSSLIVDVLFNGSTIYTTTANRPTITAGSFAAQGGTPNTTTFNGGFFTVNIAQVGSTIAGADLTVLLYLQRTA